MEPYEQLEEELRFWTHNPNVVVCSSGTAALHLALEALELPRGSKCIVPEFTMIACARAVTMAGLEPVFVDCGDDLLLDISKLEEVMTENVSAIMPVHIYGRRCYMDGIHLFAMQHNLRVIEDIAEGHGIQPHPRTDAACWSFYKNKIIAGEEGGAIAFAHSLASQRAKELRSLGFGDLHNFLHRPRGMNYRLSNVNANLILCSLEKFQVNIGLRKTISNWYDEYIPEKYLMPVRDVNWVYDLKLHTFETEKIVKELNNKGIEARLAFRPMSQQPEYRRPYKHLTAYKLANQIIYLPIRLSTSQNQVKTNVQALQSLL